jgi:hypothetical protein
VSRTSSKHYGFKIGDRVRTSSGLEGTICEFARRGDAQGNPFRIVWHAMVLGDAAWNEWIPVNRLRAAQPGGPK